MSDETMTEEVEAVVTEDVESAERPTITHEEYLELVAMRQSVLELKSQKADVLEFVTVAQQYQAQLAAANERLQILNEALNENSNALQDRMRELITPMGVTGEFTINDTEPHYSVTSD
jgi:hypothetical protein